MVKGVHETVTHIFILFLKALTFRSVFLKGKPVSEMGCCLLFLIAVKTALLRVIGQVIS